MKENTEALRASRLVTVYLLDSNLEEGPALSLTERYEILLEAVMQREVRMEVLRGHQDDAKTAMTRLEGPSLRFKTGYFYAILMACDHLYQSSCLAQNCQQPLIAPSL